MPNYPTAPCSVCGRHMRMLKDGTIGHHGGEVSPRPETSMGDRDELAGLIHHELCGCGDASDCSRFHEAYRPFADAIIKAGYRRTISPGMAFQAARVVAEIYEDRSLSIREVALRSARAFGLTVKGDDDDTR